MSATATQRKLGIIAGSGRMPSLLVDACIADNRPYFVLGIEGHAESELLSHAPHRITRLGAIGESLNILRGESVNDVVLAGRVGRPSLTSLRPDLATTKLLARLGAHMFSGDDALLSSIIHFLEDEGFTVVGADDVLATLLTPNKLLTRKAPTPEQEADIKAGFKAARMLGQLDIGQAAVVEKGYVLAVEAAEGTDGLLSRVAALKQYPAPEGVLIKVKKPSQERRIDLPAIGPQTVENAHKAGLAGIAVEAGHSIILDQKKVIELADRLSLFVAGVSHE